MSNLKDLVPPLELCRKLPEGAFEDSALVFACQPNDDDEEEVNIFTRDMIEHLEKRWGGTPYTLYPAPTLREIMNELSLCYECGDTGWFCMAGANDHWSIGNCERDLYVKNGSENKSPEVAALKLWLKLKGIEYEE